ncbi:hypothetical protein FH972_001644 [Carpinus fangiana]|uniref:Asparaginase n=1 Tax=Carpinus fangiana TaxID=176857 RepID=A0A5N6QCF1_9ROSI|nr:hypothetical protein FH972_001644 [Carpinus fangiana]
MASKSPIIKPRVIIHGGAGNITRDNLSKEQWQTFESDLLAILRSTSQQLVQHGATALHAATHAVQLFEANPKFNAGRGAVFTRSGRIELEASVMVSNGMKKRGAAVSLLKHVKSPVSLAAEILKRGEHADNGGAQGHVHISGASAEELAGDYGLEMCDESFFWTKKRWEEHKKTLSNECNSEDVSIDLVWPDNDPSWDGKEYLPQGTVGCAVLDQFGTVAIATSTGGITNKLDGRIGDTPTFGAGFWAEEWFTHRHVPPTTSLSTALLDCLPSLSGYLPLASAPRIEEVRHAAGLLGTGNGDSFLRVAAVRTAIAVARFSNVPLPDAIKWMAGSNGELQRSAGERWHKTGEGEGGIIGIEFADGKGRPVFDFNCGGLFRAWVDDEGAEHAMVFKEKY